MMETKLTKVEIKETIYRSGDWSIKITPNQVTIAFESQRDPERVSMPRELFSAFMAELSKDQLF
jgi:hypothetical protein